MKKLLLATALCALAAPAYAQVVDDPLHGCYTGGCTTFGTVSTDSTTASGLSDFGFNSSPGGATGQLIIDLLVPNNEAEIVLPTLSGTYTGVPHPPASVSITASAFVNEGDWTSGNLTDFLGMPTSPKNPLDAYLPNTQTFDATATGYTVLQATITVPASLTLLGGGQSSTMDLDLSLLGGDYNNLLAQEFTGLPAGTIITAFLNQGADGFISTAQSSSLILDVPGNMVNPVISTPESSTWAMLISGFALMGLFGWRKARAGRYAI